MRVFMSAVVCWLLALSSQSLAQPNLLDASIEELQEWLRSGQITSAELVTWYQQRIDSLVASRRTFWQNRIDYLESYAGTGDPNEPLAHAREKLGALQEENIRDYYIGSLGREPSLQLS